MQRPLGLSDNGAQVDAEDEVSHKLQKTPEGGHASSVHARQEASGQSTSESEEESQSESDVEDPKDMPGELSPASEAH